MALLRSVQDALDPVCGSSRPVIIHRPAILEDSVEDTEKTECDDGFLVEHVKLVTDRPNRNTSAGGEDGCFGNK